MVQRPIPAVALRAILATLVAVIHAMSSSPFSIHRASGGSLHGVARYATTEAGRDLDGSYRSVDVESLAHLWLHEEHADGTSLVSFCTEWADAFRGRWVAVARPVGDGLQVTETLRLSEGSATWNTDERWIHADDDERSSLLERVRWLFFAERFGRYSEPRVPSLEELALLRRAHERCADDWVRLAYGRALISRGDFAASLTVLEELGPANAADRARALFGLARYEDALRVIDEVPLEEHDSRARALWLRGLALARLGRDEDAMSSILAALAADDLDGRDGGARMDGLPGAVRMSVAEEGFRMGRFEAAIRGCVNEATRILHGRCLEALGRVAEARKQYELARGLQPTEAIAALLALERETALQASRSVAATTAFDVGDKVTHAKLGEGEVVDVEDGRAPRLLIAFERGAEKWIAASAVQKRAS